MTINPVYLYKDENGNNIKASLYDKKSIPPKTDKIIYRLNICDDRLNSLKNKWDPKLKNAHPKMCDVNLNSERNTKSLIEEPGIPELMELYYDDQYDFKTGKFIGMSEKTKNKYMSDLKIFYKIFTNNEDMPENITSFKDIKLKEYHKHPKCNGENPAFNRNYENDGSSLFGEYAENIKQMIRDVNKNQESLMKILNNLFVYTINPNTKKKQIRVSPRLTEKLLDEIVLETRTVIIRLYLNCEKSYSKGLHIYEAIVEKNILETTTSQVENLEKQKELLSTYSEEPEIAKEQELPKEAKPENIQEDMYNETVQPQTSQEEPQQPQLLMQNEIDQLQTSQEEPQQPQLLMQHEIDQPLIQDQIINNETKTEEI
jgi:cytochrome oxidase Cu insertion factor (SCO1/SenC/PrrC family)